MSYLEAVIRSLKLVSSFRKIAKHPPDIESKFYHSLRKITEECVVREDFIMKLSRDKRVLHFGFLDSPFAQEGILSGSLLHQKVKRVANYLHGIDIDASSLEIYRNLTGDTDNSILDIEGDIEGVDVLSKGYQIILFPEILEHLLAPARALTNLKRVCCLNEGAKLCITVPNAFSILGFYTAIDGIELVHPGHYYYFSPFTLRKLLNDIGFSKVDLQLYSSADLVRSPGITKHGVIAICDV